jgi:hypothetical protein
MKVQGRLIEVHQVFVNIRPSGQRVWPIGRGFHFLHFHNFKSELGLEYGPPSLVRAIG